MKSQTCFETEFSSVLTNLNELVLLCVAILCYAIGIETTILLLFVLRSIFYHRTSSHYITITTTFERPWPDTILRGGGEIFFSVHTYTIRQNRKLKKLCVQMNTFETFEPKLLPHLKYAFVLSLADKSRGVASSTL